MRDINSWLIKGSAFLLLGGLIGVPWGMGAPDAAQAAISYITQYQLQADHSPVYGIFDLGMKPSVRLMSPTLNGGKITFHLHGRQYLYPVLKDFTIYATFEDVSGKVFKTSQKTKFTAAQNQSQPLWFESLSNTAGIYGAIEITIDVPKGASVINLLGEPSSPEVSPNQLLGYISHIDLPKPDTPQ